MLIDRDKISNLYRGPSIAASYQVSVHMAEGFQRRRLKCEKLTDDRRQVSSAFYLVNDTTFGSTLQLIKVTALYSIYNQN